MRNFMLGYAVIMVATIVLFAAGHRDAAWIASWAGVLTWTFQVLAWVVFFDSRRRWPGTSALQRLGRIFSFYRG